MKDRIKHLVIGTSTILAGIVEYLIYRPWGSGKGTFIDLPIRLIDRTGNIERYLHSIPDHFNNIHGWMPNYLGAVGGCLLVIGLTGTKRKIEQYCQIGALTGAYLLNEAGQYFGVTPGTYDPNDVLAFIAGAITSGIIARATTKKSSLESQVVETN